MFSSLFYFGTLDENVRHADSKYPLMRSAVCISVIIFVNSLGSKALHFPFILSTRLKGQISNYGDYWARKTPFSRFQPHYYENHKVVSLIEPDIGCKLIRVSSRGPLSGLIAMEKLVKFFPPKQ